MDPKEVALEFLAKPTTEVLEKVTTLVKENPSAAIVIVGMLGIGYLAKLGVESQNK